jgi:hypothetical protein
LTTVVVGVGVGATTVVVGAVGVGCEPGTVGPALQLAGIVAGLGPFWMGLHPGKAERSINQREG